MAESNLDMIIRTKQEGANVTDEAVKDLKELQTGLTNTEKAMAGTRSTVGGLDKDIKMMGTSVGSTADLMSGLGMSIPLTPMMLFGQAMQAGIQYTKDAVAEWTDYVDQISIMAEYTSTSTEEMSRLYQIADDLRIPLGSLEMALKTMTQNGVSPSVDGIAKLSDQYLAIQDPLAKAQFLYDNFGRSGQDMARFMSESSAKIRDNAAAVEEWMIVTGKSEQQMMEYKAATDKMDEAQQRVAFTWATQATPVLTRFMTAILDTNDEIRNGEASWIRYLGVLSLVQEVVVGVGNLFSGLFVPNAPATSGTTGSGRAGGGDVFPGVSYPVGEREKEWFTPGVPGTISPGGGGNVTIYVDANGIVGTTDELTAKLMPVVQAAIRQLGVAHG